MRAVVYDKPFSVSVQKVEKPKILHPDDIIVKGRSALHSFTVAG
jgi:threonine dehydrogenase-like Zn-dependent dehydrogenase